MKYLGIIFSALFMLSSFVFSQTSRDSNLVFTGNLHHDSQLITKNLDEENKADIQIQTKKSPYLAGIMSVILPGAGQVYNESYWKAAIFCAIEATAICVGLNYDKKGDRQTTDFENFADNHWSVMRYADWTLNQFARTKHKEVYDKYKDIVIINNSVDWGQLNNLERELGSIQDVGYSHALPPLGEQQYYELIGKYRQYSHGWDDAHTGLADDPYPVKQDDGDYHILSPRFSYYSTERGKANDYYDVASKAVMAVYMNHIISMIEAVWGSSRYNKNLAAHFSYQTVNYSYKTEYVPTINLSYSF